MGRELKRVSLDFEWPMNQIWKGYRNPYHSQECKACEGTGYNKETLDLYRKWYSLDDTDYLPCGTGRHFNNKAWMHHLTQEEVDELASRGRLMEFTHYFEKGKGLVKKSPEYNPTAEEVNEWSKTGMGHDAINAGICVEMRARRFGVFGNCNFCEGEGVIWQSEEIKKLHEEWKDFDPPAGDGYQLWETTSEGSPISPVFETLDSLCEYLENEKVSVHGRHTATKEQWKTMLEKDRVCHREGNIIFI
jgi:hypothetical protein